MNGKIYLVGAGLGDPDLLTVKAVKVLSKTDVLLYDRLVSEEVLQLVNPKAHRIYVGKEMGEQDKVQDDIFTLMLAYAKSGQTVTRLKSGDPMVYGRGGEEWAFLAEHNIEVEVVPGISSAYAAPTLAGIPLTLRGVANGFAILSGQGKNGAMPDFKPYAQVDTLILLMAVKERAEIAQQLIAAGRNPNQLSAFIENSSRPDQHIVQATLEQVARGHVQTKAPAVWVIGEVVRTRERLIKTLEMAL